MDQAQLLLDYVLERLRSRLDSAIGRLPLDMDYLEFMCSQELVFLSAVSNLVTIPRDILDGITELLRLIQLNLSNEETRSPTSVLQESGSMGRPRLVISPDYITNLLDINCSVPTIASMIGVSTRTIFRRMAECNTSVRARYSSLTDEELDDCVTEVKQHMPHCGYRMMRGALKARGHLVQFDRVRASMHRVDTVGVLSRMTQMGCVVRRTYSVSSPRSIMHIDTNHKLIRYNIVIFGGVDGFSRKQWRHLACLSGYEVIRGSRMWMWLALCLQFVEQKGAASCLERVSTISVWKKMATLTFPTLLTSSVATMYFFHGFKMISVFSKTLGIITEYAQRVI
ncbi:uncharacterized protein LOC131536102 isoform X2 [Onychostoma macrolepis]|uniref:uncharacterized protein LOC131536102 isoform X2 n=1 Tax=Onychostoma macrolepis TaxID=369639 RepID=UPI00272D31B9|nr:uncharacterized protein LOC131536102 isoform X2 [Onychostoma macrolepis]